MRHSRHPPGARWTLLFPLLLALLLAACSSLSSDVESDPVPLGANEEEPSYAADLEAVTLSELELGTFTRVKEGIDSRALPPPEAPDPLLTRAARLLGEHCLHSDKPVGVAHLRAALEVAGAFDTFVHHEVITVDDASKELPASEELLADFLDVSAERTSNTYAVSWVSDEGGSSGRLVLLSSYRPIEMETVGRMVEPGSTLRLKGRMLEKDAEVHLILNTGNTSTSSRLSVPIRGDNRFSIEVELPSSFKVIETELVGVGQSWGRSFATMRFHTGPPPLRMKEALQIGADDRLVDTANAEVMLLEQINRDRALLGLTALRSDPGLDALARLDAEVYAVGESPEGSQDGPATRLEKWGVLTKDARVVLAEANDLDRLLERVWYDPTRRKRLLDPDTTYFGFAIINNPPNASRRHTMVGYLVKPQYEHSPAADLTDVFESLNTRRGAANTAPIAMSEAINKVVNRHAYPLLALGKVPSNFAEELVTDLRKSGIAFDYVMVDIQAASTAREMKFNKDVVGGEWKEVGVAVARGPFAKSKTDVLVAIIVATR